MHASIDLPSSLPSVSVPRPRIVPALLGAGCGAWTIAFGALTGPSIASFATAAVLGAIAYVQLAFALRGDRDWSEPTAGGDALEPPSGQAHIVIDPTVRPDEFERFTVLRAAGL